MTYKPTSNTKGTNIITAVLFAVALISYSVSLSGIVSPGLLQIVAMFAVVAAIYILIRYKYTSVLYEIAPRGSRAETVSDYDFTVSKAQGKRAYIKECVLSLGDLRAIYPLEGGKIDRDKINKSFKSYKTYFYTVNMRPEGLALVFDDEGEVSVVVIEADKTVKAFLEKAAEENMRGNNEEDN